MVVFCACAATTHILSAVTHVWPDDHALEKLDHVGIVALIVGTPLTAVMVRAPRTPRPAQIHRSHQINCACADSVRTIAY
jgi:predicted membrane channel-forming protein YqfA (hemolysin III family)